MVNIDCFAFFRKIVTSRELLHFVLLLQWAGLGCLDCLPHRLWKKWLDLMCRWINIQAWVLNVFAKYGTIRGLILTSIYWTWQYNFVGRILGPRGNSLKRVELATHCRVFIRGRGSVKDTIKVWFLVHWFSQVVSRFITVSTANVDSFLQFCSHVLAIETICYNTLSPALSARFCVKI